MEIRVKIFSFPSFIFFPQVSITILSSTHFLYTHLTFKQLMTSPIGSRIEYLIPIDTILVLLLHSNLREKYIAWSTGFWIRYKEISEVAKWLTFWATQYINAAAYSGCAVERGLAFSCFRFAVISPSAIFFYQLRIDKWKCLGADSRYYCPKCKRCNVYKL